MYINYFTNAVYAQGTRRRYVSKTHYPYIQENVTSSTDTPCRAQRADGKIIRVQTVTQDRVV